MNKTIVISPSGNFYGSEQVLYDHLSTTTNTFKVFVPKGSIFKTKLDALNKHKVNGSGRIQIIYLRVILCMLFNGFRTLYINEGGHIKYTKLVAKLLPFVTVYVHIRLIEDATPQRLGANLPSNLKLISISQYIHGLLNESGFASTMIYDPMHISEDQKTSLPNPVQHISFIGRVTPAKGIRFIQTFIQYCLDHSSCKFHFHFYGSVEKQHTEVGKVYEQWKNHPQVHFHGFIDNQQEMYMQTDVVAHLNPNEPLGRIGLEAWSRGIPFVCFSSGGCGEINSALGATDCTVKPTDDWESQLEEIITNVPVQISKKRIHDIQEKLQQLFSVQRYVKEVEHLF